MRIVFCGTPAIAVPTLRWLLADSRFTVTGVITQPDRPRGRGLETGESAVKLAARQAGLDLIQPARIREPEAQQWIEQRSPDAVVLIAYGQIIPAPLLAIPRFGWINLHASLLPRYRGAAPIAWAIADGETRTGVSIMQIDAGMDTGPVLLHREMEIGPDETAPELAARMAEAGAPLVVESLEGLEKGSLTPRPQDSAAATYARILKKEDGRIAWESTAQEIYNRMRGFAPWPGAFTGFRDARIALWGRPWKTGDTQVPAAPGSIIQAGGQVIVACGQGTWLQVTEAQPEGRRRMTAREFASGARISATGSERFG